MALSDNIRKKVELRRLAEEYITSRYEWIYVLYMRPGTEHESIVTCFIDEAKANDFSSKRLKSILTKHLLTKEPMNNIPSGSGFKTSRKMKMTKLINNLMRDQDY